MCDNFGKRQADEVPATPCKRIKVLEDSHRLATSASSSNSSTTVVEVSAQGNYRQQPVADFEDGFEKQYQHQYDIAVNFLYNQKNFFSTA